MTNLFFAAGKNPRGIDNAGSTEILVGALLKTPPVCKAGVQQGVPGLLQEIQVTAEAGESGSFDCRTFKVFVEFLFIQVHPFFAGHIQ